MENKKRKDDLKKQVADLEKWIKDMETNPRPDKVVRDNLEHARRQLAKIKEGTRNPKKEFGKRIR